MFYFRKYLTKDNTMRIDSDILYILDEGNKTNIDGCMAVQLDTQGRVGQRMVRDNILGYSKITDPNTIYQFFDTFAEARTKKINEDKIKALEEKKKELEPYIKELIVECLKSEKM